MNELLSAHKETIRRELRGYDSSLKMKKVSLVSILDKIDADTSISDEKIGSLFNHWYNSIVVSINSHRIKPAQGEWVRNNITAIRLLLKTYSRLNSSVYRVDESLINWYRNSVIEDGTEYGDMYNNDLGFFLFQYNNRIYSVEIYPDGGDVIQDRCVMVGLVNPDGNGKVDCSYSYGYEIFPHEEDEFVHKMSCLVVECNNTKCPRYKQEFGRVYNHDFKDVHCSADDCEKCGMFSKSTQLSPKDALTVAKAIYKCILHRNDSSSTSTSTVKKEYEHIPRPERLDDVIIYFGDNRERDKKLFDKLSCNIIENGIVDSHASPREHVRHNGSRRGTMRYNPKTGKKDIKVKGCDKVKDCVVNKGHTKTSYTLKERGK